MLLDAQRAEWCLINIAGGIYLICTLFGSLCSGDSGALPSDCQTIRLVIENMGRGNSAAHRSCGAGFYMGHPGRTWGLRRLHQLMLGGPCSLGDWTWTGHVEGLWLNLWTTSLVFRFINLNKPIGIIPIYLGNVNLTIFFPKNQHLFFLVSLTNYHLILKSPT